MSAATLPREIEGPFTVIGDLHGQNKSLNRLLDKLRRRSDFLSRWLVFMGDFVDRGEDPKSTLDTVSDLMREHSLVTGVMGNHDLAFICALGLVPVPDEANWPRRYLYHYHPRETFHSFGVEEGDLSSLKKSLTPEHRSFIIGLPWCVEHPEYLMVHAGLLPDVSYKRQLDTLRARDFSHHRPPWLCERALVSSPLPEDCPLVVISGHVRQPQVVFTHQKILVDTSGGHGRNLSAVLLPEKEVITA